MNWLKTIWTELVGLFVDDISLAVVIVLWLAAAGLIVQLKLVPTDIQGPLLALGLVVIFMENTLRRARM